MTGIDISGLCRKLATGTASIEEQVAAAKLITDLAVDHAEVLDEVDVLRGVLYEQRQELTDLRKSIVGDGGEILDTSKQLGWPH